MTREQVIQKQTDEIMDEFDFGLVRKMFEENGWTYQWDSEAPSLGELRKVARSVIRGATEDRYCYSGRFSATCVEDSDEKWLRLSLMFTPTSWVIDEGEVYE